MNDASINAMSVVPRMNPDTAANASSRTRVSARACRAGANERTTSGTRCPPRSMTNTSASARTAPATTCVAGSG